MKNKFLSVCMVILLCTLSFGTIPAFAATYGNLTYEITDGEATLTDCETSATAVTIPSTIEGYPVTGIGSAAFYNCSRLTSVTIGNGVTSIGSYAFDGCSSLTSITIPDSVTSIGNYAFYYCNSLTSITIPDRVKSIGEWAFYNCSRLTNITIPDRVKSIGEGAFDYCSSLTSITIPDSVRSIGERAFSDCSRLTSVTIGNGVTSIGISAFSDCSRLTSVTIGNGVTSIGISAFSGCSSLTSITIPDSVRSIGERAFSDCSSLTSVTIGSGVTSIGSSAFSGCSSLTNITIPDSVTSIGENAFYKCSSLTSITIPDSVTSIGDSAFYYCKNLTSITIPDSVTSIGDSAFCDCYNLTSVTIPDSVTSIGERAFHYCSSLTSVTIGNGVTSIGERAFDYCSNLTSVTIGNGVTSIGNYAFYDCSSLTSITIPDSVTSIGKNAFYDCSSLKTISYNGTQEDWDSISIGNYNAPLLSATKHFFFYVTYIDENKNETRITVNPEEVPDVSSFEKTGYTLHLYTDEAHTTEFDKNTPITENTTLYVICTINQHTYKFLDSDGSVIKEKTVDYGTEIIPPANPSDKDPYTFDYWKGYTSGMTATSDQTFTAVYKYKNYTITADGLAKPISVTYNSTFTIPPQTKNDYCYFIGYFTEKNGKGIKITNEKGESLKPYNTIGDITVYPHFYEGNMNKIVLQGTASVIPGDTVTQKAVFATETNASYLIATIRYPDWLILKSVEGVDFAEVSKDSETPKDGYKELQITCIYDYNSNAIPTCKDVIPFELKFSVSTNAPIGNAEISLKDVLLIGEADYPISETESAVLEILPKLAERIQISGPSAIDKTTKYTASVSPDYTTDKTVTWSVDNESIATVSEDGFLTPVMNGTVTLTATAKDGSGVYARKTVSVTVYAKINTLVSDCGVWETNFVPEIYDYTIYVKNDTASITLTPNFVNGALKSNGTGLWISGRSKSFDLPDKETVITLNRSNVANATDKAYNITVIKLDGIQTEVSEDGTTFTVNPANIGAGKTVSLVLYENGRLAELQTAVYNGAPLSFTTENTYTDAKVMVWNSLDSLKPICEAEIIK